MGADKGTDAACHQAWAAARTTGRPMRTYLYMLSIALAGILIGTAILAMVKGDTKQSEYLEWERKR